MLEYTAPCPSCGRDAAWSTVARFTASNVDPSLEIRVGCRSCDDDTAISSIAAEMLRDGATPADVLGWLTSALDAV